MQTFIADQVRLPDAWASDVRITVDEAGTITAITPNAPAAGAAEGVAEGGVAKGEVVRLSGPVVPAMPNLHSHAFQRAMAGLAERGTDSGDSFWSWRRTMYDFVHKLTPEDVEAIAAQLFMEMLKGGYAAVAEFHYLHNGLEGRPYADPAAMSRAVIAAARTAGIALTHLPVLYMTGGLDGRPLVNGQRRFEGTPARLLDLIDALRGEEGPDLRLGLALHSLRAVPPRPLRETVSALTARDATAPIHIHIAEQPKEVEECVAHLGARPVEFLLGEVPVDQRWCLVHATHMTTAETTRLARSGAVAGLCPTTEANLGDGLFRWETYRRDGGAFGIGSDSHVTVDAREELRLLHYGQRLTSGRRAFDLPGRSRHLGARLWLDGAEGGARALGRPTGRIAVGCRADLLVLDPDHPALMERTGDLLLDALVFAQTGGTPIAETWVGGRRQIHQGRHPREEEITGRYRRTLRRLLA